MIWRRQCKECGKQFEAKRQDAVFCGSGCRLRFNNRRITRGAELYDLVMEMRFDRAAAKGTKAWSELCYVAGRFRDEDKDQRDGRKSWSSSTRLKGINSRLGR